jgi:hypothetical protein
VVVRADEWEDALSDWIKAAQLAQATGLCHPASLTNGEYLEYIPASLDLAVVRHRLHCHRQERRLGNSFVRSALLALIGPLAIPVFLTAKREKFKT